jgi:hypothetical protein
MMSINKRHVYFTFPDRFGNEVEGTASVAAANRQRAEKCFLRGPWHLLGTTDHKGRFRVSPRGSGRALHASEIKLVGGNVFPTKRPADYTDEP